MKDVVKGYLAAFISAVTYGMIPMFMIPIKQQGFSVDTALFYRFITASLFIMFYLFYRKETLRITPREVFIFLVLGLLYALSAEFLFLAYDLLSPGIASTIFFMYPLIVALALGVFFKEHITFRTMIALIVVLIGVFLLSVKDVTNFSINYIGAGVSLLGAISYALYMLIVNKSKISASGIKVSFYSTLFSSVYFLVKLLGYRYSSSYPRGKDEFTTHKFRYSNYPVFYHHPYLCYQNDRFYPYSYHWGNGTHCSSSYQYLDIPARKSYNESYYRSATHYHCSNDRYFEA